MINNNNNVLYFKQLNCNYIRVNDFVNLFEENFSRKKLFVRVKCILMSDAVLCEST